MFNSKKRVKDMSAPGSLPGGSGGSSSTASGVSGLLGLGPTSVGNIQKLEMAKRLALKINAQKNLGAEAQVRQPGLRPSCFLFPRPLVQTLRRFVLQDVMQQATNAILRGGTILTPSVSAKTIAEQLAEKINAKLNYTPVEKLEEERQAAEQVETVTRYEEELEINDFPQVSGAPASSVLTRVCLGLFEGTETDFLLFVSLFLRLRGGR